MDYLYEFVIRRINDYIILGREGARLYGKLCLLNLNLGCLLWVLTNSPELVGPHRYLRIIHFLMFTRAEK